MFSLFCWGHLRKWKPINMNFLWYNFFMKNRVYPSSKCMYIVLALCCHAYHCFFIYFRSVFNRVYQKSRQFSNVYFQPDTIQYAEYFSNIFCTQRCRNFQTAVEKAIYDTQINQDGDLQYYDLTELWWRIKNLYPIHAHKGWLPHLHLDDQSYLA